MYRANAATTWWIIAANTTAFACRTTKAQSLGAILARLGPFGNNGLKHHHDWPTDRVRALVVMDDPGMPLSHALLGELLLGSDSVVDDDNLHIIGMNDNNISVVRSTAWASAHVLFVLRVSYRYHFLWRAPCWAPSWA